jgi:hypothetical protein
MLMANSEPTPAEGAQANKGKEKEESAQALAAVAEANAEVQPASDLDAKDLKDRLRATFKGLAQVRVVTAIGDAQAVLVKDPDGTFSTELILEQNKNTAFVTLFNLADGDVTNVLPPKQLENEILRSFHAEQVERSLKVLPDNLRAAVDIAERIIKIIRGQDLEETA